jgi:hypothetical protein
MQNVGKSEEKVESYVFCEQLSFTDVAGILDGMAEAPKVFNDTAYERSCEATPLIQSCSPFGMQRVATHWSRWQLT